MKIKRNKIDILFSKLVRQRDDWTCTACGKYYPEGRRQGLHCSHIFSRRHTATRWSFDNAVAHCFACHQRLGENPVDFTRWAEDRFGKGFIELLREKAHSVCKMTKAEKEELYQHLKQCEKEGKYDDYI